jgi:hypothetical protein
VLSEHSSERRAAELEEMLRQRMGDLADQHRIRATASGGDRVRSHGARPHLRVVK